MRNMGKGRYRNKRRTSAGKILVLFKEDLIVMEATTNVSHFISCGYQYITTVNLSASKENIAKVRAYYDTHPERLVNYFLQ